jgi:hypothetical protein
MQKEFEDAKLQYEQGVDKPAAAESMAQVGIQDIQDVATGVATPEQTQRITDSIEVMRTQDPERAKNLEIAYGRAQEGVMPSEYGDQLTADRNAIEAEFIKSLEAYLSGGMGIGYIDQYAMGGGDAEAAKNVIRSESIATDAVTILGADRVNAILDQVLSNNGVMPAKPTLLTSSMLSATEQRIIAAAQQIKQPELLGGGGRPTIVSSNNNGNVTRGGDTNVSHTTNIYGVTPAKALNEGNSVPRPYYANQ